MTISDTYRRREVEFEEDVCEKCKADTEHPTKECQMETHLISPRWANAFNRTTITEILSTLIEKLEGEKEPIGKIQSIMMKKGIWGEPLKKEINPRLIKNTTLTDTIDYLRGEIDKINHNA